MGKLRIRSNDGENLVLEHLDGEDALTWTTETPEEAEKLAFFPVGTEVDFFFDLDLENPANTRLMFGNGRCTLANFELPE